MIPKIIHQMYKDKNIPSDQYRPKWIASWKLYNPEFDYIFWTDEKIDLFIETHYPSYFEFIKSYDQKIKYIDASRYFILHYYGGIYVDLDFECFRPIAPIFSGGFDSYLVRSGKKYTNAIIASQRQGAFMDFLIQNLSKYAKNAVLSATGPSYVTDRYEEFLDKKNLSTLDKQIFFSLHYKSYIEIAKNDNDLHNTINLLKQDESVYGQHHFNGHWL